MKKGAKLIVPALALAVLTAPGTSAARIKVRYAHWGINPWIQSVIKAFNASQDRYLVEYDAAGDFVSKVMVGLAGGVPPTVFSAGWFCGMGAWMDRGLLMDLTPFTNRDKATLQINEVPKMLLQGGMYKGKLYAFPFEDIGANCIWYNSMLFKNSGLPMPPDNWTIQDYVSFAHKLTKDKNGDGKNDQVGVDWLTGFYQAKINAMALGGGGFFFSGDHTTWKGDSEENIKALKFLYSLMFKDRVTPYKAAATDFFGKGNVGMMVRDACMSHYVQTTKNKWNFNVAPPPILDGKNRGAQDAQGTYLVIAKNAKKQQAEGAWEFIKFWTGEEGARAMWDSEGWIQRPLARTPLSNKYYLKPKSSVFADIELSNFIKYRDTIVTSENWPIKNFDRINQLLEEGWSRVCGERITVEQFIGEVSPKIKQLLAKK